LLVHENEYISTGGIIRNWVDGSIVVTPVFRSKAYSAIKREIFVTLLRTTMPLCFLIQIEQSKYACKCSGFPWL